MDRLPCGVYFDTYKKDMAIIQTRSHRACLAALLIFLCCIPLFAGDRILALLSDISITVIAVQGLNILTGACGQISLGHTAFMAVGAYTSGYLVGTCKLPFWMGLISAGLLAGVIGLIFGFSSLRIKGFYLILVTVAAQFILVVFLPYQLVNITGGANGLNVPDPSIMGLTFNSETSKYALNVGFAAIMVLFAKNLLRTRVGRAFIAIRDNDLAASVMGISVYRYKVLAFFLGCFYAGIAGSLFAHYVGHVDPGFFPLEKSIWYLAVITVGGMGSTAGAVMGAIFLSLLNELTIEVTPLIEGGIPFLPRTAVTSLNLIIPGIIVILFLVFEPRGLYHRWQVIKGYFQRWP